VTTLIPPPPTRAPHGERDMDALLDILEERAVDPPSVRARTRSLGVAAAPHVAAAARRLADAASVALLLVLVPLTAVLVVTAETAARGIAACELPRRARTSAHTVAGWDLPRRARSGGRRARAWADHVWADHILTWPARPTSG
jgi:hypothetical protein